MNLYSIYITSGMEIGVVANDNVLLLDATPIETENNIIEQLFDFITPPRPIKLLVNDIDNTSYDHPMNPVLSNNDLFQLNLKGTLLFNGQFSFNEAMGIRDVLDFKLYFFRFELTGEVQR